MKRSRSLFVAALSLAAMLLFSPSENASSNSIREPEPKMRPSEQFYQQRSFPETRFDLRAYEAAMQAARSDLNAGKTSQSSATGTSWTLEGPGNISGRINAIAMDPNDSQVLLAGAAVGGIFKTTDGGSTWKAVFDDHSYLAIGDITYEPGNSQVIYAGTGDPNISAYPFIGDGVYKSTDGGESWNHVGLTNTRTTSRIVVDPTDVDRIYVATMGLPMQRNQERGLFRSTDGGNTWSQSLFVSEETGIIDLQLDPGNPQVLYASSWDRIRTATESVAFGDNAKIWKTTDGGDSWNALSTGLPNTPMSRINLALDPTTNPAKIFAAYVDTTFEVHDTYQSTDAGASWESHGTFWLPEDALGGFGWFFGNLAINPYESRELYLMGVQLWRNTAKGAIWDSVVTDPVTYPVHVDNHDILFTGPNSFYLATDGGLFHTSDDGQTWSDAAPIPNTQVYRLSVNPHAPGEYFAGFQDNGTAAGNAGSLDGWRGIFGGDGFQAEFTDDPDVMLAETQRGNVWFTLDAWKDFAPLALGLERTEPRNWDSPLVRSKSGSATFYFGMQRVYKISDVDYTSSWVPISPNFSDQVNTGGVPPNITAIAESPLNEKLLYAGTSFGTLHTTTNAENGWQEVSRGLPYRYLTSVKASPLAEQEALVTFSGYKYNEYIPHILHSTDQGASWQDVSGDLPQLALNDVLFHPYLPGVWVVASDGGVYVTENSGQNWTRAGDNMPLVPVYDLAWDMANMRLVAGTHGRGVMSFSVASLYNATNFEQEVRVFPNPAKNALWISAAQPYQDWEIFDLRGRRVLHGVCSETQQEISLTSLLDGIYLVRVNSETGHQSFKIFKR